MESIVYLTDDLLAAGLIFLLSYVLGRKLFAAGSPSSLERMAFSTVIGMGVLGNLTFLIGTLGWLNRMAILLLACATVLMSPRWVMAVIRRARALLSSASSLARVGKILYIVLWLVLLIPVLVQPLYPATAWDATTYHFPHAKHYAAAGRVTVLPEPRLGEMPQLQEMLFSIAFLFGGEIAAQLVQFMAVGLTVCLLYAWAARESGARAGMWAAGFYLSNPLVLWLGASGYIDSGLTLFVTGAAFSFRNWAAERDQRWLVISGVMSGFAVGSKLTGLVFLALIGIMLLWYLRRSGVPSIASTVARFAFPAAVLAFPWLLRSYLVSGNPVSPFLSGMFGNSLYTASELAAITADVTKLHGLGRDILSFLALPWNLAFRQIEFMQEAPVNSLFILIAPLALVATARRIRVAPALTSLYVLFWFEFTQILRYLVPVFPLVSLCAGVMMAGLVNRYQEKRKYDNVTCQSTSRLVLLLLLVRILYYSSIRIIWLGFPPLSDQEREHYLTSHISGYSAISWLNQTKQQDYCVYGLYAEKLTYFADGTYKGDCFGPSSYSLVVSEDGSTLIPGRELFSRLAGMGSDYLLTDSSRLPNDSYFSSHFKIVQARPKSQLLQLTRQTLAITYGPNLLQNPRLEEMDQQGHPLDWETCGAYRLDVPTFSGPTGATAIETSAATPDDGLFQNTNVSPGGLYRIGIRARSDFGRQAGEISVSWLDGTLSPINPSDTWDVVVEAEWKSGHTYLTAPGEAAFARLHIRPVVGDIVWFDDLSFVEVTYTDEEAGVSDAPR